MAFSLKSSFGSLTYSDVLTPAPRKPCMKKLDKIHYDFTKIDGYNLPWNFVIGGRDDGKTTGRVVLCYKHFQKTGQPSVFITRNVGDVSPAYAQTFIDIVHDFIDDLAELTYQSGQAHNTGILDIYQDGKICFRIQGLNKPVNSIKRFSRLKDIKFIVFDEFICNPKFQEKYLNDEFVKFRELVKTYQKDNPDLKIYLMGNPYTMHNPYFMHFGINTDMLKQGHFYTDRKTYVLHYSKLSDELIAWLQKHNPDYQKDGIYSDYALNGTAINDQNLYIMHKIPDHFKLYDVFKVGDQLLGCYKNTAREVDLDYYVQFIDFLPSQRRDIICFDFADMINNSIVIATSDKWRFEHLKYSMRNKRIAFHDINAYYIFEEIYYQL